MKFVKSHFWYHKSQRNGILFLVCIICILQLIIFFDVFSTDEKVNLNQPEILAYQKQIDSLKAAEIEKRKPKIYPFNPNYITDFKGEKLGMSLQEIDRLLKFRKTGNFVNSKNEFQKITKVSDSLLNAISPYFKFPDWVVKRNEKIAREKTHTNRTKKVDVKTAFNTTKITSSDINKATLTDFLTISGVETKLAERIIKYRSKLQGFSFDNQLYEVWGLDKKVANRILSTFQITQKPIIKKENINTITFKQLLKNPYVDYELCKKIFDYRDEVAELQNINQLKNIESFPLEKYDRIVLYLLAE